MNRYVNLPPDLSSIPSSSRAGKRFQSTRLEKWNPNATSKACQLTKPENPGHPTSCFNFSSVSVEGWSNDGAGQPETSLHANANA